MKYKVYNIAGGHTEFSSLDRAAREALAPMNEPYVVSDKGRRKVTMIDAEPDEPGYELGEWEPSA